ncbi:TetR/AcrR family transcriptional regulator [Bradyrhizobium diazoefficiens]|uniref:TetR/AcrR family transcriptional regulator n=1 Tax=Bradyrhizobium diazoefficiens TaxID=1355477 RepID=UPI00190C0B8A|nr:TetR/AcrR family transcriptional regulator [Bradyrhizobium diazoefficiens]MBK3664911.1 TetR/AcrR family transcriptional regulator [Bradyrhizobium diazoefficiens]
MSIIVNSVHEETTNRRLSFMGTDSTDTKMFEEKTSEYVKKRRRQQRSADTRERILKVAYSEFAELGFEGTSTRTIAAKANVQHPLVIYHFKSKEGLWKAVMTAAGSNFTAQWQARMSAMDGLDDVAKLRLIQEDFVRFAAVNADFHWLMANEGDRSTDRLRWIVENRTGTFFRSVAKLIRSAQRAGRYVEGDPDHLLYLFIGAVTRIFMQAAEAEIVMGQSPFSPSFVERHVTICCSLFFRDAPAGPQGGAGALSKRSVRPSASGLRKTPASRKARKR